VSIGTGPRGPVPMLRCLPSYYWV